MGDFDGAGMFVRVAGGVLGVCMEVQVQVFVCEGAW